MENNYKFPMMELKGASLWWFFNTPLIKRTLYVVTAIIFPWLLILKLITSLRSLKNQNSLLSRKVNELNSQSEFLYTQTTGPNAKFFLQAESLKVTLDEVAGLLNWPEVLDDIERKNGFYELLRMLSLFANEKTHVSQPSSCWVLLATKNCNQLLDHGYYNFKRTIGHNYFNFLIQKGDSQIQAVESLLSPESCNSCRDVALAIPHDPMFSTSEQFSYHYFVLLLWEYVKQIDTKKYLDILTEPKEGNPILVSSKGKTMSQDLANSLIEYYSMQEGVRFDKIKTVLEIGGGYGRNAHVILSLNPGIRLILVDILPALYIAQRYLSSVFKDRKVFKAKNFTSYEEVKDEIESASIVFLMPQQLELLPDKYVDLCINISSFGEMNVEQIRWYFSQMDRLTDKYFYMKQWKVSQNPFDGLILKKDDYPFFVNWQKIYSRDCAIQTEFFETLYQVNIQ